MKKKVVVDFFFLANKHVKLLHLLYPKKKHSLHLCNMSIIACSHWGEVIAHDYRWLIAIIYLCFCRLWDPCVDIHLLLIAVVWVPCIQLKLFFFIKTYRGNRSYKPNPRLARVLDVLFILHAEHEMNCSTAAARHLASRYASFYEQAKTMHIHKRSHYIFLIEFTVVWMSTPLLLELLEPCMVRSMVEQMR